MYNGCRITLVSVTLATPVTTVSLTLMSVSRCRANTTPPAGSGQTRLVQISAMPLRQASTVHVLLDSLVT